MTDIDITRSGELMVAHVEAQTDAGAEFVDAYVPVDDVAGLVVVDSGRIVIPDASLDEFVASAKQAGLEVGEPVTTDA